MQIRSVSFDTSFLLKDSPLVDTIIKQLSHDSIPCYITSTVVSELERLKIWGRITQSTYKLAIKRWKRTNSQIIDFKNRLLSTTFGQECVLSMEKHHGVKRKDIENDCNILVTTLKKGVDVFLSEDFHFTSKITKEVISEVINAACTEYHQMCETNMFSVDSKTFLKAYSHGQINIDIVESNMKNIKKDTKRLKK